MIGSAKMRRMFSPFRPIDIAPPLLDSAARF
jgi:hypothetical protein